MLLFKESFLSARISLQEELLSHGGRGSWGAGISPAMWQNVTEEWRGLRRRPSALGSLLFFRGCWFLILSLPLMFSGCPLLPLQSLVQVTSLLILHSKVVTWYLKSSWRGTASKKSGLSGRILGSHRWILETWSSYGKKEAILRLIYLRDGPIRTLYMDHALALVENWKIN